MPAALAHSPQVLEIDFDREYLAPVAGQVDGFAARSADDGLAELEANVDSLIVVLNEKLLEVLGDDVTQDEAFAHANDVLRNAVAGIAGVTAGIGRQRRKSD